MDFKALNKSVTRIISLSAHKHWESTKDEGWTEEKRVKEVMRLVNIDIDFETLGLIDPRNPAVGAMIVEEIMRLKEDNGGPSITFICL